MRETERNFPFKDLFFPLTTKKAIAFIILVGAIVYFNSLFGQFIWDDLSFISNQDIRSLNILHLLGLNVSNTLSFYRPVSAIYLAILFKIFNDNSFYYHFIQMSLHILNACLVFVLFKKFFKRGLSFFLALLFLVHPIQVESVAYIAANQSEIFFLFGILALLISTKDKLNIAQIFLIPVLLLLSLFTKETGFLFVLLLLFFQFLFRKKRLLFFAAPTTVVLLIYLTIRLTLVHAYFGEFGFVPVSELPLMQRVITMPKIIFYYIKTLFYPANLAIDQQWVVTKLDFQQFYLPVIIDIVFFILLSLAGVCIYRKNRKSFLAFIFFFVWFLMGVGIVLQIIPLDMTVADRWFYFPLVGFLGCLGALLNEIHLKNRLSKTLCLSGAILIVVFSVRTIVRNQNWQNQLTLYSHDVRVEANYDSDNNYAAVLSYEGKWDEAYTYIKKSVELYPYEKNLRELGLIYKHFGKMELAKDYFYKALDAKTYILPPHKHEIPTYEYISEFQYFYGDTKEAVRITKMGIDDYPDSSDLWILLAISEYKLKNQNSALKAAEKAYSIQKTDQTTYLYRQLLNSQPLSITTGF